VRVKPHPDWLQARRQRGTPVAFFTTQLWSAPWFDRFQIVVKLASSWRLGLLDVLARTRALPRQRGLSLDDRRRNVRGSVVARGALPAEVCVVDDVYTSGATVDAAARACRTAGARVVRAVTFARAVR